MLIILVLSVSGCSKKKEATNTEEVPTETTVEPTPTDTAMDDSKNELQMEDIDATMQKLIFEKDEQLSATISEISETQGVNLGTYTKTIASYELDQVSTEDSTVHLVQLYWQSEAGENPYNLSWFDGTGWLINVFLEDGQIVRYEVLPCNLDIIKTAMGLAKLMENGSDAIELAYNTYLDDSMKSVTSKEDYEKTWNDQVTASGAYAGVSEIYFGYNRSFNYPYTTILWQHENQWVASTYQFSGDNSKAIGSTMTVSADRSILQYATLVTNVENQTMNAEQYSLKDIYKDYFKIGCATPKDFVLAWDKWGYLFEKDFNSATMENEMKADAVLDYNASVQGVAADQTYVAIRDSQFKAAIELYQEKGVPMRYHTFVWHQQTPSWFFYEDYDIKKNLVDAETMEARMKNFITQVIQYLDTNYPDVIYTIDVVNEAFNGSGTLKTTNVKNLWYDTIGYDYVYYGFLYAREAIDASTNMKDVTLVYNDYNMPGKVDTVIKGLDTMFTEHGANVHDYVDAIGFQAHYDTDTSMASVADAIQRFCNEGYEVQVTELDIGIPNITHGSVPTEEQFQLQAEKYRSLMERLMNLKDQGCNITSVTIWGMSDDMSWRQNSGGKDAYAVLLDGEFGYKPAYFGMALDDSITSYFDLGINY